MANQDPVVGSALVARLSKTAKASGRCVGSSCSRSATIKQWTMNERRTQIRSSQRGTRSDGRYRRPMRRQSFQAQTCNRRCVRNTSKMLR